MPPKVSVKVFNADGQLIGPVEVEKVEKTEAEWRAQLTPEQFQVARAHGTERPFCGTLLDNKRHGVYTCICCGLPLFASNAKFDSGTGWPSFFQPVADENVAVRPDLSYGMRRIEGIVLPENHRMLSLAARLGFEQRFSPEDGLMHICRNLDD